MQTFKAFIRLHGCTGRSELLLAACYKIDFLIMKAYSVQCDLLVEMLHIKNLISLSLI